MQIGTPEDAVFSADCLVAEPKGSHQIVAVKLDDKLIKIVASSRPKIKSGEHIHLGFKQSAIHFFDKESGQRI